jgi:hypothetical protein
MRSSDKLSLSSQAPSKVSFGPRSGAQQVLAALAFINLIALAQTRGSVSALILVSTSKISKY